MSTPSRTALSTRRAPARGVPKEPMAVDGSDRSFASDYLLLNPDEVGARDLCELFLTRSKGKRKYCETREDDNLADGWILFVSLFAQKLLKLVEKPLAWMGAAFEMALNLLSVNGGVVGILCNALRGKVAIPNESSKYYWSVIAHLDGRVDVDQNIEPGCDRFYQSLSLLASKIVYENKAYVQNVVNEGWKMELLSWNAYWNDYEGVAETQAFMFRHRREKEGEEMVVLAFRGTQPFRAHDWRSDFDLSWYRLPGVGKVHAGFMKALGMQKGRGWPKEIEPHTTNSTRPPTAYYHLREVLREVLAANPKARLVITGHSLGGALAIIFPSILALHGEDQILGRLDSVYTFGQPRVGDEEFGQFVLDSFKRHQITYLRFVYCNDMVPRIPFDDSGRMFKHFGTCLYYNSTYKGAVVEEEPFKNYFSIFAVIPMTSNAVWEIVRAFIYPRTKGPMYREGWLMLAMRAFGLVMPGIPPHIPQDYHNSTLQTIAFQYSCSSSYM